MKVEVFVVFHKNLYPENYAQLTPEEFKCLTFVAVNPTIPKSFPTNYKVINEWELPIYDETLQKTKWNENSVLIHLYQNNLVTSEFVGFAQYDMHFNKHSISAIMNMTPREGAGLMLVDPKFAFLQSVASHELKTVQAIPKLPNHREAVVPLLNTYIIHCDVYIELMKYILEVKRTIKFPPNANPGGIFERVNGYALSQFVGKWYQLNMVNKNTVQKPQNY